MSRGTGYSIEAYERLLRAIAAAGYSFVDFAGLDPGRAEPQVVLRHDVDGTLHGTTDVARIDAAHGIKATFFFLLRSHVYNLFSPWTAEVLGEVSRLGHDVALHCRLPLDPPRTAAGLASMVQADLALARGAFPGMKALFSWHAVSGEFFVRWRGLEVPGLVNAYADPYFTGARFISDSNARYSVEELESLFRSGEHPRVQLLLHPIIWGCGGGSMIEVWSNAWKGIIREVERDLRGSQVYGKVLPAGVSASTVDHFARSMLGEARDRRA